jgi:hypothetical protein
MTSTSSQVDAAAAAAAGGDRVMTEPGRLCIRRHRHAVARPQGQARGLGLRRLPGQQRRVDVALFAIANHAHIPRASLARPALPLTSWPRHCLGIYTWLPSKLRRGHRPASGVAREGQRARIRCAASRRRGLCTRPARRNEGRFDMTVYVDPSDGPRLGYSRPRGQELPHVQ